MRRETQTASGGYDFRLARGYNPDLFTSPAEWISPNNGDTDYLSDPPAADGTKVIIADTDHLCGVCGDKYWVWKSFTRG